MHLNFISGDTLEHLLGLAPLLEAQILEIAVDLLDFGLILLQFQ